MILPRKTTIKIETIKSVGMDMEKLKSLKHCWWEYKMMQQQWKTV